MFGSTKKASRLGQWNGRRHSSRADVPMLPRLWQRPVMEHYPQGLMLVERGKPITGRQLALLEEERRAYESSLGQGESIRRGAALFLIFSLLAALIVMYVGRFQVGLAQSLPTIVGV